MFYQAIKSCNTDLVIAPLIESYAARFSGITNQLYMSSSQSAFEAHLKIYQEFANFKVRRSLYPLHFDGFLNTLCMGKAMRLGIDLPPNGEYQINELEIMTSYDYQIIIEQGVEKMEYIHLGRLHNVSEQQIDKARDQLKKLIADEKSFFEERGIIYPYSKHTSLAGDRLCMMRSFPQFVHDIYTMPKTVLKALNIFTQWNIKTVLKDIKAGDGVLLAAARMSSQFFSPKFVEEFVLEDLLYMIDSFLQHGLTVYLHLDTNWIKVIHHFKRFKGQSIVIELDGATDMKLSRKILGEGICLLGDISASMMTLGTPDDIINYINSLIDDIGYQGLILSTGCCLPYKAKHENVAALLNYKKR